MLGGREIQQPDRMRDQISGGKAWLQVLRVVTCKCSFGSRKKYFRSNMLYSNNSLGVCSEPSELMELFEWAKYQVYMSETEIYEATGCLSSCYKVRTLAFGNKQKFKCSFSRMFTQ